MPHEGDAFQILTASDFGGTMFSSTSFPALSGNLTWNIHYGAATITLSIVLPGDFNGNGVVDAADYIVWRIRPRYNLHAIRLRCLARPLRPNSRQRCGFIRECRRPRTGDSGNTSRGNAGDVLSPTPGSVLNSSHFGMLRKTPV